MSFFSFLFYLFLFILIKIGDAIYNIALTPLRLFSNTIIFNKKTKTGRRRKKKINGKTIRRQNTINFELFSYLSVKSLIPLKRFFLFTLNLLLRTLKLIAKVIFFPLILLFRFSKVIFRSKLHKKRFKKISTRTSIGYKLKYIVIGTFFALIFFFVPATVLIFISDLPKLSNLSVNYVAKTTKILDRNGNLLFEIYANQNRTVVELNKIPKKLIQATIAIEDKDFYKHKGFDIRGIARAFYVDITKKDFQGGSTITQQLVKSALLTPEPTISRKAKELVLSLLAEQKYTKDQILELYFNYVPYGGTAWGVEAASQIYFGKTVTDLDLAESAYLAGLPQAPTVYSPFASDGKKGKQRQKEVLDAMENQGYITPKEEKDAYSKKLTFRSPQLPIEAPHFVMYVKDLLAQEYGLPEVERGGLQVTTTLDINDQKLAEQIVSDEVDKAGYLGVGNGAALVTNPQNGDILAMVGSRDYFDPEHDGNVNIATSLRQPGSTIKVVTYALALSKGMTEATILDDTPLTITSPGGPSYTPVNYDGRFHGKVPLRIAFANSFNIPAVRVAQKMGVDDIVSFGKKMGITTWNDPAEYGLSITLGAAEVTMTDLATVYGTVANSGQRVNLDPILKVTDSEGKVLYQKEPKPVKVLDPGVAYIISDILSDNKARSTEFGTNSPLAIPDHKVSVKTGTSDNKRDNWTVGYTPNLLVATWVGNNDNTPLSQALASGITGAAPIWNRIMTELIASSYEEMKQPGDIVSKPCYGYTAYFLSGTDTSDTCQYKVPTPTFQKQ